MTHRPGWWQYNIALVREPGRVGAAALFSRWGELLQRVGTGVQGWFFMRKPPDVRLRVCAVPEAHSAIARALQGFVVAGEIGSVSRTMYEPHVNLFGGPHGMELVHDQFHRDSMTWLALSELERAGQVPAWEGISVLSLTALLTATLAGLEEILEVWCGLQSLRPATGDSGRHLAPRHCGDLLTDHPAVLALVEQNRSLGRALRELALAGELACGERAIVTQVAHFHFNRWGLRQAPAIIAMMVGRLQADVSGSARAANISTTVASGSSPRVS